METITTLETQKEPKPMPGLVKAMVCKHMSRQLSRASILVSYDSSGLPDNWKRDDIITVLESAVKMFNQLELCYENIIDSTVHENINKMLQEVYENSIE